MVAWKAIGSSVIGSSHIAVGKSCEDAVAYTLVEGSEEVLISCVSDGAGSASFAAFASGFCTNYVLNTLTQCARTGREVGEETIFKILEGIYEALEKEAALEEMELNEFSCTLLGCYITDARAVFFQIGDGAIVRAGAGGFYTPVWMPDNGEYQNTTSFVIDDRNFGKLKVCVLEEQVTEVALFTDGLQMLALNMEAQNVHQPFFVPLFKYLRLADNGEKLAVLQRKLTAYLESEQVIMRTDDDKTLFLATRAVNL